MLVCVCIRMCMGIRGERHIFRHECMHMYTYVCMYISTLYRCVCLYVYVYVCVWVYGARGIYLDMSVCICVYVCG